MIFKDPAERRRFLVIFVVFLITYSTIAYVSTTPRPREEFLQIYVLGPGRMAEKYYPNDDSNIRENVPIKWFIGVTNFMNTPQLVAVKIKLGNAYTTPPNQTTASPSDAPQIAEYRRLLLTNDTWEFPFIWRIESITTIDGKTYLTLRIGNSSIIEVKDVKAEAGRNFRIIIELWTLDKDTGEFIFGWKSGDQIRAAWLQLWFNATTSIT